MTDRQFTEQPFYNDDVMIWLTAGWLDDDDPCAYDESEASE